MFMNDRALISEALTGTSVHSQGTILVRSGPKAWPCVPGGGGGGGRAKLYSSLTLPR